MQYKSDQKSTGKKLNLMNTISFWNKTIFPNIGYYMQYKADPNSLVTDWV